MRLIDADELLKALVTQDTFGYSCNNLFRLSKGQEKDYIPYIRFDDVVNCINNIPTAYKIEKVVEQLEDLKDDVDDVWSPSNHIDISNAIEIVKAGGK